MIFFPVTFFPFTVLTCTHNLCFVQKQEKHQTFSTEELQFLQHRKNLIIIWACIRNDSANFVNLVFKTYVESSCQLYNAKKCLLQEDAHTMT